MLNIMKILFVDNKGLAQTCPDYIGIGRFNDFDF